MCGRRCFGAMSGCVVLVRQFGFRHHGAMFIERFECAKYIRSETINKINDHQYAAKLE